MEPFSQWLESELEERGWRPADLAHRAELPNATLSRILNGHRRAGPEVCVALAAALEVPPEQVFRLAGLLPPAPPAVEEEEMALGLFRSLDAQMRAVALSVLRSLKVSQPSPETSLQGRRPSPMPPPRNLSERLAQDIAREVRDMPVEDQQRMFDLMRRLRDRPGAKGIPAEGKPS
jgi:transcriptional regulator with XRE-family HTH domain